MRWVFHLGVHKTGSTLLQQNLVANGDALLKQGIYAVNALWPEGLVRTRARLRYLQSPKLNASKARHFSRLTARIGRKARIEGAGTVVISEENFLGVPIHRELNWGHGAARFYPEAERCLDTMLAGLPPKNVRVILYTRRLDALLRGHYVEALRHLATSDTFEQFLSRTEIESFRFDLLLARLRRVAPDVEYIVRPFETIRAGATAFVEDFMRDCGADPARLVLRADRVNHGFDIDQAEQLRHIAELLNDSAAKPRELKRRAREIQDLPADPGREMTIPPAFAARVAEAMKGDRAGA